MRLFTKDELKRLKYTKMLGGMSEQEADNSLKELVAFQIELKKQKMKDKPKIDLNKDFKTKFAELTNER